MVRRFARGQAIAWLSLCFALFQVSAAAQTAAETGVPTLNPRAVALFQEARALMSEGKYGAACPKFEESLRIQPGIGTLYNLADCYEKLGHTAKAWRRFREAASKAAATGDVDRAAVAQKRADALEPLLMKLSIDLSAEARAIAGLMLSRDGSPVPRDEWGVAVPVDPGNYRVSATAPGRREWSSVVIVREPGKVIAVNVPELPIKESAPSSDAREERPIMPAIVLAGLGLAGLGTGVGLTVTANRKSDDAASLSSAMDARAAPGCNAYPPNDNMTAAQCTELLELLEEHDVNHNRAVAAYTAGGALLGLAAASLFLWPAPSPKRASVAQVGAIVTRTEYGIRIQGSF